MIERAITRLFDLIHRHAHPERAAPLRSVLGFLFCCLVEEVNAAGRQCNSVERLSEFLRAKGPSLKLEVQCLASAVTAIRQVAWMQHHVFFGVGPLLSIKHAF